MEEFFPIVDEECNVVGKTTRKECHSGSFILHPVVHLHVFNSKGELYMQKRSEDKDIQPGKWDTSVGGHVDFGESVETALRREASEELDIKEFIPVFAFMYPYRSDREYELVNSYFTTYDKPLTPDPEEISEGRFWTKDEITENLGKKVFTPNFENEILKIFEKKAATSF